MASRTSQRQQVLAPLLAASPAALRLGPAALAALCFCLPHAARAATPAAPTASATSAASAVPGTLTSPASFAGAEGTAPVAGDDAIGPSAALAATPESVHHHAGVLSSTLWGGRGIANVASAYPLTRGAFTLTVSANYLHARNLFVTGDKDSQSGQTVHAAYSPVQGLELALSHESLANNYTGAVPRNLQLQGNPTLRVKYGHHVAGPLALGVLGQVSLPTVEGSARALFAATSFKVQALLSLQPIDRLEIAGNLGYSFDRSRLVFRGEVPDVVQRFVFGVNEVSSGLWGLGATGRISLGQRVDLLPFAEMTGSVGMASRATLKNNPVRATLGLRGYMTQSRAVELVGGCDVRVAGGPQPNSPFGGLAPWRAYAQITVHLGEHTRPCAARVAPAAAVPATFRLRGRAVDADTGVPVLGAAIHVAGDEASLLFAVDEQSGQFVSAPQPTGDGNLHLVARAPGYVPAELDVPRSRDGQDVDVHVQLRAEPKGRKVALLKGSVRDADRGEPLVGAEIDVPALKRTLHCDKAGAFATLLKPGRYGIVVRAPGFAPQRKVLQLRAGESVVLNVELEAAAR